MYRYDEFDHSFVQQRTAQFRDQANRRLSGELTEEEFRPLRLMNGLYLQLHAYMLRGHSLWHLVIKANAPLGLYR
jgi:sulfite reductase (NADPH) hemoprotein beta-component